MKRGLAATALLLAVTGCGSTAVTGTSATGQPLGADGLGLPTATTDPRVGGPTSAPGTSTLSPTAGAVPAGPTGAAGTPTRSAGGPGPGGQLVPSSGRGVTATTLTIGIVVSAGEQALANSLGVKGASSISTKGVAQAAVDDINRHGGVFGRKLLPYFHEMDSAAAVTRPNEVVAKMCNDFRDDHKVFAVFTSFTGWPDLRACMAKMGTPLIGGNGLAGTLPRNAYDEHGGNYLFSISAITQERLAYLYIDSLWSRSFFEKWNTALGQAGGTQPTKLAAIHPDTAESNTFYALLSRELAKHGLRFAETVTYTADLQSGLAATQNAVLKFRSAGVTHVFGASVFFLQAAEQQSYRPRYAYQPGLGALGVANSPPAQMRGAQTVGWTPTVDVRASEDPGETPAGKRCRSQMARAGYTPGSARGDLGTMYAVCDWLGSFRAALVAGGGISVPALRRGFELLGSTFPTSLTFKAILGPTRHNGVDTVRDMAYDTACSCLKYTSRKDRS